jgi:hypothetical protein
VTMDSRLAVGRGRGVGCWREGGAGRVVPRFRGRRFCPGVAFCRGVGGLSRCLAAGGGWECVEFRERGDGFPCPGPRVLQVELSLGVRRTRAGLEAVTVMVGEREPRAGMRVLTPYDQPGSLRPRGQLDAVGDLGDLSVLAL